MAEAEAAPVPEPTPVSGEGVVSKESYEKLRAELDEKTRDLADARARSDVFEQKERTRISSFQPAAKEFIAHLLSDADAETAADLNPLKTWSDEFNTRPDILAQAPLARLVSCASAKLKRSREEASANSEASVTLGKTMKDLETMTAERDNLRLHLDEAHALSAERQEGLEKLGQELAKAGLMTDKFDFSKLSSRETTPNPEAATPAPAESGKAVAGSSSSELKTETALASRAAPTITDALLSEIIGRGGGALRSFASGTTHQLLGGANANGPDLAHAIRTAGAVF